MSHTTPAFFGVAGFGVTRFGDLTLVPATVGGRLLFVTGAPAARALVQLRAWQPDVVAMPFGLDVQTYLAGRTLIVATAADGSFSVALFRSSQLAGLRYRLAAPYGLDLLAAVGDGDSPSVTGGTAPGSYTAPATTTMTEQLVSTAGSPLANTPIQVSLDGIPALALSDDGTVVLGAPQTVLTDASGVMSFPCIRRAAGMPAGAQLRLHGPYGFTETLAVPA